MGDRLDDFFESYPSPNSMPLLTAEFGVTSSGDCFESSRGLGILNNLVLTFRGLLSRSLGTRRRFLIPDFSVDFYSVFSILFSGIIIIN